MEAASVVAVDHRAAAARDHGRCRRRAGVDHGLALELAETSFTFVGEQLGDGHPGVRLDDVVGVDERSGEPGRARGADRRLPRSHEPDQHEVAMGVLIGHVDRSDAMYPA
jgi:hypothetical protein